MTQPVQQTIRAAAPTVRLTVAQATLRFLCAQHSVRDGERRRLIAGLYAIFGHGNVGGLGEALAGLPPGALPFLEGRNEQAMVHAAAAYARASRRLSTLACASSIGPGALNMLTAAAGAHVNRVPVLLLPSDEYATRRQGTILQGLEHPRAGDLTVADCFRPVARYFDRIVRPEQLVTALPAAMRALTSPEDAGPVILSLPQDVQVEAFDFPLELFEERDWQVDRPVPDPRAVAAAAELVRAARRPLIVAGGGVRYAGAEAGLRAFAERHGIPVAETYAGKGVLAEGGWRDLGGLGVEGTTPANAVAGAADLVLCAGTRLADFVTGSQSVFQHPDVRFVGLNLARMDARKAGALPLVGDLAVALEALSAALGAHATEPGYRAEVAGAVDAWHADTDAFLAPAPGRTLSQPEAIRILNEEAGPQATIVAAAGTAPGELLRFWDASDGSEVHIEFGFSCMGYEIPGGIGAKLAHPEREVFVLVGDGTFLLAPTEIAAAVQHGVKITVVVSDNDGMHSIRRLEEAFVHAPFANLFRMRDRDTRVLSEEPVGLDLELIGRGLGAVALRADGEAELREALRRARADPRTHVVVVATDPTRYRVRDEIWRDVAPAEVSEHPAVRRERAAYEAGREERQRRYA